MEEKDGTGSVGCGCVGSVDDHYLVVKLIDEVKYDSIARGFIKYIDLLNAGGEMGDDDVGIVELNGARDRTWTEKVQTHPEC